MTRRTTSSANRTIADPAIDPAGKGPSTRAGTKQAKLIEMLRAGATLDEMVTATGWQSHTVRGAMAGALKKRLGLTENGGAKVGHGSGGVTLLRAA